MLGKVLMEKVLPINNTDGDVSPTDRKSWILTVIASFLIIILLAGIVGLLLPIDDDNTTSFVAFFALSIGSVFLAFRFPKMLSFRRITLKMAAISILAGAAINLIPGGSGSTHLAPYLLYGLSGRIIFIVFICFLLPVIEEIYFRGLLYPIISKYIGYKAAALITVTLFTLGHNPSGREVLLLGLSATLYTWLVHRTGSVISGILAHSAGNSAWLILAIAAQHS